LATLSEASHVVISVLQTLKAKVRIEAGQCSSEEAVNVLKIGVIGTGDVARKLYLPGIHNPNAGVVLQAVCDIVRERAEAVARDFGAQKVYTDAAEMLEREDLDLVFVLTPLLTHPPIVRQVLQSGKNCYS